jgi:hypothetical protein
LLARVYEQHCWQVGSLDPPWFRCFDDVLVCFFVVVFRRRWRCYILLGRFIVHCAV